MRLKKGFIDIDNINTKDYLTVTWEDEGGYGRDTLFCELESFGPCPDCFTFKVRDFGSKNT